MKNKRIRFDDRFYWTLVDIVVTVVLFLFLLLMINNNAPLGMCAFMCMVFSLFLCGIYAFPRMGLHFNYRLGLIKYLGPHIIKKRVIKMHEIEKIDCVEIYASKGRGMTPDHTMAFSCKIETIYRNGKIFKFIIYLKNNDIIEIPYYNLFRATSKKRVMKQEKRINDILTEFNLYIINRSV